MEKNIANGKILDLMEEAQNLEERNNIEKALDVYNNAFDLLVAEAKNYAQTAGPGSIEAVTGSGSISQIYLDRFNESLKKDKYAAIISCRMASIFYRMGNESSAKIFFEQAIDLTPENMVYDDPHIGLAEIGK